MNLHMKASNICGLKSNQNDKQIQPNVILVGYYLAIEDILQRTITHDQFSIANALLGVSWATPNLQKQKLTKIKTNTLQKQKRTKQTERYFKLETYPSLAIKINTG